jgi:hypothetical protein
LVGLVLTVFGLWNGWLPTSLAASADGKAGAAASTASASSELNASAPPPSDSAATSAAAVAASAGAPPSDPCARGSVLLAEYVALYGMTPKRADYLLALVPDPELNRHSSNLSAVLEGLEEAFAAEGNLFPDRKWLPWGAGSSKCAESAPGMLLFRPSEPRTAPPRVLLLVGETPTWGARKEQLESALRQVPLEGPPLAQLGPPLKVLGPTFSGTAASLLALLTGKGSFELTSGTATSPKLVELFSHPPLHFSATVPNDDQLLKAMLEYLRPRSNDSDRIAILKEAGTAYGSNVGQAADSVPNQTNPGKKLIELRFPVDLEPLRQAVAAAPAPSASAEATVAAPENPHMLVLDEVARDLSAQRVRFVGVVASDPADVILFTGRLRSKIPDARFFTLGADIQLADPALASLLNGTLVAHAASPDAIDDAVYNEQITRSVSLKSEVVRNVYLAGRKLLGHPPPAPAVRISLIGNGALWEIGDQHPSFPAPRSYWKVLVLSIGVFIALLLVVIWPWLSQRFRSLSDPTLSRCQNDLPLALSACFRKDLAADDALVSAALLFVAVGAALLLVVGVYAKTYAVACWLATGIALLACWSQVLYRLWRGQFHGAALSAVICSLLATVATVFALGTGCGGPHEATLHLFSGGSGVLAGLIGFGMFTVGLWCWRMRLRFLDTHRFGVCQEAAKPPLAQAFAETELTGNGLYSAEKQLLAVIHSPWSALPIVPVGVHLLLAVSVGLVFSVRTPAAFEPGLRNGLVIGFGLLSLLPITVNFARIVATWIALNRVLQHLALLPILEPLRKLPKKLARNLEQQLTVPHADLTELGPPIELLKRIAQRSSSLVADAEKAERSWLAALRREMSLAPVVAPLTEAPSGEAPPGEASAGEASPGEALLSPGALTSLLLAVSAKLPEMDERDEYRALLVAIFVPRYVRHFRLFIVPVLVGSALGVMMTSLYFLQPQRLISMVVFVWVTAMVSGAFLIYSALDRTAVVSAIGNTTEGSVDFDWTVVSRLLSWGIVPLLSLFAAQNSNYSNWVSVLVNALSKALR